MCQLTLRLPLELITTPLFSQAFAQLLRAPQDDADAIIKERFPVPRLVVCDQHGSQVSSSIYLLQMVLYIMQQTRSHSTKRGNKNEKKIQISKFALLSFL